MSLRFNTEINLSNMLTIVGALCAVVTFFLLQDKRITATEERDRLRTAVEVIKEKEQTSKDQRTIESILELKVEVAKVNTKLDVMRDRNNRLDGR